jgi:hypothetical protein
MTLLGPRTFVFDGNLQYWNRLPDLPRLSVPTLVNAGMHDEVTPASAMRTARALPNAECHVYRNASHMPYYECPDEYFAVLTDFLAVTGGEESTCEGGVGRHRQHAAIDTISVPVMKDDRPITRIAEVGDILRIASALQRHHA